MNLTDLKQNIYMIGIGGVSMSGIAAILKNQGFNISGYDDANSSNVEKLISEGIDVTVGDVDYTKLDNANLVVYSAAIGPTHKLFKYAVDKKIPMMERADFLGLITKHFSDTLCIAGTHGKTTTTSMVANCFLQDDKDPSIQVGAYLNSIDGNYKVGNSQYFIIESCEFHRSFLKFFPKSAIILNIDDDHLDYYKSLDNIKQAFYDFVNLLPNDGVLVYNNDDINSKELPHINVSVPNISFGIETDADFVAKNITFVNGFPSFDVFQKQQNGEYVLLDNFELSVPGYHNIYNALSCIALCTHYNVTVSSIKKALKNFTGASRRFEFKGHVNGAKIFDDYAHHPTEINATANAMKNLEYSESYVIFQPHTYSRTIEHLEEFANSLTKFDHIVLLDIYAAREKNPGTISSKAIDDILKQKGFDSHYIPNFDDVQQYIKQNIKEEDILITLGAGTVTQLSDLLNEDK